MKNAGQYLGLILLIAFASIMTSMIIDYMNTNDDNCHPTTITKTFPLTPGETYTDPGPLFQISLNTSGVGAPAGHHPINTSTDRFLETTNGTAYREVWRNSQGNYCFTVFAYPTGQRADYYWLSDTAMYLLDHPIP